MRAFTSQLQSHTADTTDPRDVLHWLPVQQRTECKVSLLIYKSLHQAAPMYLTEMCVPVSAIQW